MVPTVFLVNDQALECSKDMDFDYIHESLRIFTWKHFQIAHNAGSLLLG